jgi:hypothetical protein
MELIISDSQLETIANIGNEIETIATKYGIEYIDACIMYCEKYNVEVETLGSLLKKHQNVVSKIRQEAENLNCIEKQSSVKIDFE